ncbi:MAG: DUF1573 domain-containing protein [Phycisphaerae bacterium]|nr:DUF1573 domain-containing protein [Phycisphaerae bacterium]
MSMVSGVVVLLSVTATGWGQSHGGPASGSKLPTEGPTWQTVEPMKTVPPPVRVEPEVLELGDLLPNTKTPGEFRLTNTGTEPLQIRAAMSTCSCTVAQLMEQLIEPGKTVVLPITFDSGDLIRSQERDVVIRFSGYSKSATGKVRANTNYGIRAQIDYTPEDQRRIGVVSLSSVDGEPFRVLSANGVQPEILDGEASVPRSHYEVKFDLSGPAADHLPKWFVIETDHHSSPIIDLPVENLEWEPERTYRPWSLAESRVLLGTMPPLAQREIVVTVNNVKSGGLDFVQSVWVEPPIADVAIFGMEQAEEGLKIRLKVTPKDSHRGVFVATVKLSGLDHEDGVTLMGRIADPGSDN